MRTSHSITRFGRIGSRESLGLFLLLGAIILAGCGEPQRELAPLTGKVLYKGEPLRFGSVMIEHEFGQPATAEIQPDGTFSVVTRGEGGGTAVGKNRVRIACFEGQDPERQVAFVGEDMLGKSLIPEKYASFETSGLTVDVAANGNKPVVLELE